MKIAYKNLAMLLGAVLGIASISLSIKQYRDFNAIKSSDVEQTKAIIYKELPTGTRIDSIKKWFTNHSIKEWCSTQNYGVVCTYFRNQHQPPVAIEFISDSTGKVYNIVIDYYEYDTCPPHIEKMIS